MRRELEPRQVIRRLNAFGLFTIVILAGGAGGWAATSHISGAVIASGTIVVESNVKRVQHPTGGVVGQILARDGDEVHEGQVVIRLDDTITRSTFGIVESQLGELRAREARLIAERDGKDNIPFPPHLLERSDDRAAIAAFEEETLLFESRRKGRIGERGLLKERIAQINEEIRGLSAQQQSKEREIAFISEELAGVKELYSRNLVSIARLTQLQRDQAKLEGDHGHFSAERARASGKISEINLQILQVDQSFRTELLKDLREAQGKIAELQERRTAALDQFKRVDIRAPQSGLVHQSVVHTVGGVIANGETLMQIVPRSDTLVVEARVLPQDIDQIMPGVKVVARILAGNQRTMRDVNGAVSHISADLTRESQTNSTYYLVRATLSEDDVQKLDDLKLVPGMPIELFIETQERTPLQYLIKPLQEQIARAFRER